MSPSLPASSFIFSFGGEGGWRFVVVINHFVWWTQTSSPEGDDATLFDRGPTIYPPQLMKLAVLNELRMAIGSFAPCEVVMEGSTRVLPLVALRAAGCETLPEGADAESSGEAGGGRRTGVSPNRHPQARMGAANLKVRMDVLGDALREHRADVGRADVARVRVLWRAVNRKVFCSRPSRRRVRAVRRVPLLSFASSRCFSAVLQVGGVLQLSSVCGPRLSPRPSRCDHGNGNNRWSVVWLETRGGWCWMLWCARV